MVVYMILQVRAWKQIESTLELADTIGDWGQCPLARSVRHLEYPLIGEFTMYCNIEEYVYPCFALIVTFLFIL